MITTTTTALYAILIFCNAISFIIGYWIGNDKNKK